VLDKESHGREWGLVQILNRRNTLKVLKRGVGILLVEGGAGEGVGLFQEVGCGRVAGLRKPERGYSKVAMEVEQHFYPDIGTLNLGLSGNKRPAGFSVLEGFQAHNGILSMQT